MKRHPRYFILGYGHDDVRPLPKVSDDMIDKLYEKIIPYDGKHNEFGGTKREYVAKIIELFGGMVGSGNGTDEMTDYDAEYVVENIVSNLGDFLKERDASQRDALALAYGQSGVASKIGKFHEEFVKENVLDKFAEKDKIKDVTQFGNYTSDTGRDIGAITDFGALKKDGTTALFEVKSSGSGEISAQPTKFVVAARTLEDDNFSKEYNILFTDIASNTVKKLDIAKLIKDMPDRPAPSDDMFNERFRIERGKVNRLEMNGRKSDEWKRNGDAIMEWMQSKGYGSISEVGRKKMFKFNQDNAVVKENIKTVYKEKYVDPHSTQAKPMPAVPSSASMALPSVPEPVPAHLAAAPDVDIRKQRRERKAMEKYLKAEKAKEAKEAKDAEESEDAKKAKEAKEAKEAEAKEAEDAKKAKAKEAEAKEPVDAKKPKETEKQKRARLAAEKKAKDAEALEKAIRENEENKEKKKTIK